MTNYDINADEMSAYTADPNAVRTRRQWWRRAVIAIAAVRRRAAAERAIRTKIEELRALDDWLLADIGLTRTAIEHAVRNGHPRDL
jgi:uncharacterized protein YjiS (DUF1127 family)